MTENRKALRKYIKKYHITAKTVTKKLIKAAKAELAYLEDLYKRI